MCGCVIMYLYSMCHFSMLPHLSTENIMPSITLDSPECLICMLILNLCIWIIVNVRVDIVGVTSNMKRIVSMPHVQHPETMSIESLNGSWPLQLKMDDHVVWHKVC